MSWLNVRALTSLLVLALLALPLVAPFAGLVVPASGQPQVFTITSYVATPEGLIGFYLNYSHARVAVGLTGLTLDFYVSADGTAAISPGDVRVGRVTVTVDTVDVFGTLKLPDNSTLYNLLGAVSGTLFVKVSDGFRVIVASTPFDLRASKLFKALTLSKTRLAFYNNTEFAVGSATNLTIDLTPYDLGAMILGTFNYNITRLVSEEHVYRLIEYNGTRTPPNDFESDVATWAALSSYGDRFTVNFTRLKEFPLNNPEKTVTFRGVTFNYEDFTLEYFAGVFKNYTKAIKVDAGRQVNTIPENFTNEVEVKIGLAWPRVRTVDIFPSVGVTDVNRGFAGVTGELNVDDRVSFALRNFPKNMWIFWEAWVYGVTLSPRLYAVNVTAITTTNVEGSASLSLTIPATQYGGRLITFTFYTRNYTLGPFRGAPATNTTTNIVWREAIKPHVWIWSFNNTGMITPSPPTPAREIAPGSYVLVVGRGFIAEPLIFELVRATDGVKIEDLTLRSMVGVLGNGSFAAIVQLPVETLPPDLDGTSVYVVAKGTVTTTNVGRTADITPPGAASLTLDYDGGAAAVYINPTPQAVRVKSPFGENRIALGADVYPYAAVWEPEARRVIVVEAIGLNRAWAVRAVNVTLRSIGAVPGLPDLGIVSATLALNEPVTFGYFKKTYPVPTLPHTPSGYQVVVRNGTNAFGSDSNKARAARINATIAVIDPADGVPRRAITLAAAEDVNVIGYGWAARLDAYYDIQPIVFAAGIPLSTSGSDGVLRGVVRLPLYITQPGSYRVIVYQVETRASNITLFSYVDVSIGVLPAFTIKLVTSPAMFADLPLEVWVVAFFGGRIARTDQIESVVVEAFARDVGETSVSLRSEPRASPHAVYYGSLRLLDDLGAGVKGKNVLLVATAVGRYVPEAPLQEAYDVASVTVPPVTTVEMLEGISRAVASEVDKVIRELSRKLEDTSKSISDALDAAVTIIRGDIAAVRSDLDSLNKALKGNVSLIIADVSKALKGNVSLILDSLDSLSKALKGNVSLIQDLLDKVNTTVLLVGDDVKATLSRRLDRINTTLIGISGNVTEIAKLVREANLSISRVVVDEAGKVVAELRNSEGRIVGAIVADVSKALKGNVSLILDSLDSLSKALKGNVSLIQDLLDKVNTTVLLVGDDVKATLSRRLDRINTTLIGISGNVTEIAKLVREANLSISRVVVDEAGKVVAELRNSEGKIVGAIVANATALSDLIRAVRIDLDGVRALLVEVNENVDNINKSVGLVGQAVLVVRDDVRAVLSRLDLINGTLKDINGTLAGISGGVAKIITDVEGLAKLVREANLSISRVVVDEAGKVVAELRNSEGKIVGAIVANATALSDLIRAVRIDLDGVRALLVEVNENVDNINKSVGLVGQAVLVVGDDVRAVLSRLDLINGTLAGISGGVAKIITDVEGLAKLVREANLSISRVVVDEAGKVVAELRSSEGRIVGAISTNAATLSDLIRTVETRVRGDVRGLSDALAAFQSEALSRLDAVAGGVDTVRSDLARLRTDAAAMAGVVAGIQATVSRVDTNVGNLAETVRTISTTVDSINRAVPGLATKADVSGAQAAITGAVDRAKSDIESAVKDAGGAAAASSRNWGIINALLIIIAIAILAYATFVARRP